MSELSVPAPIDLRVEEPFDEVYLREYASLVRMARVLVDTTEQAEEVVQESFAALYVRYRSVNNPVAYVRAAVLNRSRNVLRRRKVSRAAVRVPREDAPSPFNHVLDAVRRLPPRQRAVVLLRYELQLTDTEIAETLAMPVGTVKSTMFRALARLREEITK